MRRWLVLGPLSVVLWGLAVLAADPVRGAPLSACTAHHGTVVAVDFAHWRGPIVRGCGIGEPTGYALLHAAGFTTAGDAHDGTAFMCRIGNRAFDGGALHPTPSEARCAATPSTSAYWSFWLAPAGQNKWTYSPLGPMGDVPKPGEVELWMFGATDVGGTRGSGVPKLPPSTLRAASRAPTTRTPSAPGTTPTPGTTPSPRSAPTASRSAPTTVTHATSPRGRRVRATHQATTKRRVATRHRRSRRPARKPPGAAPRVHHTVAGAAPVVAAQPAAEHTSSGSALPLVVGLGLALILAAGAVWTVRRRRYE